MRREGSERQDNLGGENTPQARFMSAYPAIRQHAKVYARGINCPGKRADFIQETIAIAYKGWLACERRGLNPGSFISAIADYAVRQVRGGRKATGGPSGNSKRSDGYLAHRGLYLLSWEELPWDVREVCEARLYYNRYSPVAEQAAFRVDFPRWLTTLPSRLKRQAELSLCEARTLDIARKLGITPGAVSQARRSLKASWEAYTR